MGNMMINRFNYLALCIVSLMVSGCELGNGGDSDELDSLDGTDATVSDPSNVVIRGPLLGQYPEPLAVPAEDKSLGFYDYDGVGQPRVITTDLEGGFEAMVQFGQSHIVDPNGNEAKKMPRLTAEKEALLLVTPTAAMGDVTKLSVDVYLDNQLVRTVQLDDPSKLPGSDQTNNDNRARVNYSKKAWSARLNWDEVRSGLKLRISDQQNRSGELAEEKIDFAAPGELVLNNIRIGMLTTAPQGSGHYMIHEPAKAGSDYFQTIPAAEMTVAKYEDVYLDRVMVSNGTIYDTVSNTTGDVYSGDMRGDVAKSTFSVGINLANWGVTSAGMANQNQPQLTQTVIAHHAKGNYTNGAHSHGLSGGNGMLTLYDSVGNEFSHEIGHHYGLGHYPGQNGDNHFWTSHHADSGWGYIPYRNMMRGNLIWNQTSLWTGNGIANFLNLYPHSRDSMAGGFASSSISRYTHYTGYSTFLRIQPHFDRYVWDEKSSTGYMKWNKVTRKMEEAQPKMPNSVSPVWYQAGQNYPKPRVFGKPVITILGGYDPHAQVGILYPAARSNWGNVYNLPTVTPKLEEASCWLKVQYPGSAQNIALAPTRLGSNANKLHVNLDPEDKPQSVDLYCKKANTAEVRLSNIAIPTYADSIAPAVKIGRESGYSALRKIEMASLQAELEKQASKTVVILPAASKLIYESYKQYKHELSPLAIEQLNRYEKQENVLQRLDLWINSYKTDVEAEVPAAIESLNNLVGAFGLGVDNLYDQMVSIKNNNHCLKVEKLADGSNNLYISGSSACKGDLTEKWIFDALGRIHYANDPSQCITSNGGGQKINLAECSQTNGNQVWTMKTDSSTVIQGGQCFDLGNGYLTNNRTNLLRWGCNGTAAQRWTMMTPSSSLILAKSKPLTLTVYAKHLRNIEAAKEAALKEAAAKQAAAQAEAVKSA